MKSAIVGLSFGAVVLGLFVPSTANRLGHALIAVLAVSILVALLQPAITNWDIARSHPFSDADVDRAPSLIPVVIAEIVDEIAAPGRVLSPKSIGRIRTIASGRLAEQNADVALSPMLQAIVDDEVPDGGVGVNELEPLLTELESL